MVMVNPDLKTVSETEAGMKVRVESTNIRFGNINRTNKLLATKSITFKIYDQYFEHMKKLNGFSTVEFNKFITPMPKVISY